MTTRRFYSSSYKQAQLKAVTALRQYIREKYRKMRKTLLLSLMLAGAFVVFPLTNANAAETSTIAPQWSNDQWQQNRRWNNRNRGRVRVTYQTRYVRIGRALYKETYQVRYLPNGRTQTRLVDRDRVRSSSRW